MPGFRLNVFLLGHLRGRWKTHEMGMENRLEISRRNENTKIQKDEVNFSSPHS